MTSDPKPLDADCRTRVLGLLCENDEMLLEQVKQLHEDMEEMRDYTDQLRDEFDRVYDALNKANAMISGLRMAAIFLKYQQKYPALPAIDRMAWNALCLMIGGEGEDFLPLDAGVNLYSPGPYVSTPEPIEQAETNGVEYGEGNLRVTKVKL